MVEIVERDAVSLRTYYSRSPASAIGEPSTVGAALTELRDELRSSAGRPPVQGWASGVDTDNVTADRIASTVEMVDALERNGTRGGMCVGRIDVPAFYRFVEERGLSVELTWWSADSDYMEWDLVRERADARPAEENRAQT